MRILLVSGSADWSIRDVATGYHHALTKLGHDVRFFPLNNWIKFMGGAMGTHNEGAEKTILETVAILQLASEKSVIDAMRHQADLVIIISGVAYHPDALWMLHDVLKIKTALVCTESPYNDSEQEYLSRGVDLITVNDKASLDTIKHPNIMYLPHAYDPEVHYPREVGSEYQSDVFFVGTGFSYRQELLEAVDWTGVNLKVFGHWNASHLSSLQPYLTTEVLDNAETVKWYSGAKVGLNIHRNVPGYSANPRVFELAACGTHQLVDSTRPEIADLFGDSVCYFEDGYSLNQQVRECLADPKHRERKVHDALERVQGHTFEARAMELLDHLEGGVTSLRFMAKMQ